MQALGFCFWTVPSNSSPLPENNEAEQVIRRHLEFFNT
ncbi:hypothetical protein ACNKHM_24995 [Shigella sonnei]